MMLNSYFTNPVVFLLDVLFTLYMTIVALRIIMQWARSEYHNPLVNFIIRASQVPVKYLRQVIHPLARWDAATIVLLILLAIIKLFLLGLFQQVSPSLVHFFGFVLADIFSLFITIFTASIIIQVILRWVAPQNSYNPVTPLISQINQPLLRPVQKLLPPIDGIDLAPLVVILGLQVLSMLVLPILTGHI